MIERAEEALDRIREAISRLPLPSGVKSDHIIIGVLALIILLAVIGTTATLLGGPEEVPVGTVIMQCATCGHVERRPAADLSQKQLAGTCAPRPMDCPECGGKECLFLAVTCAECGKVFIPPENLHWQEPTEEEGVCPHCGAEHGKARGRRPALRK